MRVSNTSRHIQAERIDQKQHVIIMHSKLEKDNEVGKAGTEERPEKGLQCGR